ncbi:MAG: B12-binding domain-containing radical SAM protein, partial [Deltaproteobacteria bacterium]|nr:B12-binding domain-containing radical SAM protein [Deltaproteobacteria bacterium]
MKDHPYFDFLHLVRKPARYIGREYFSRHGGAPKKYGFLLVFPDLYEIGMSHMGMRIIYSMLNAEPDISCERLFAPDTDLENELRARNAPLVSLERRRSPADFDICGFSLQHELNYTNVLTVLELGGIPLHSRDRTNEHPFVIGGGPLATHPEPIADFFDFFYVGDAEEKLAG